MRGHRRFLSDRIEGAIGDIYAAATEPARLPQVLDAVADLVGAKGMMIGPVTHSNQADPTLFAYASEAFHAAIPDYLAYYVAHNPRKNWLATNRSAEILFSDHDFIDRPSMDRHEFYNDFLIKNDNLYSLDRITSKISPGQRVWLTAQYSRRAPVPDMERRRVFELLSRHLIQALAIYRTMHVARPHELELIDRFACGAVLLNRSRRILRLNAVAERMQGTGLSFRDRRISTNPGRDAAMLDEAIERAVAGLVPAGGGDLLALSRDGGLPLLVQVLPLRPEAGRLPLNSLLDDVPRALVLLAADGGAAAADDTRGLRLLGLTPAEARMAAAVGQGLAPDEAAVRAGVALSTARHHLKRAYEKLGIRRQADLVRLVAGLGRFGGGAGG